MPYSTIVSIPNKTSMGVCGFPHYRSRFFFLFNQYLFYGNYVPYELAQPLLWLSHVAVIYRAISWARRQNVLVPGQSAYARIVSSHCTQSPLSSCVPYLNKAPVCANGKMRALYEISENMVLVGDCRQLTRCIQLTLVTASSANSHSLVTRPLLEFHM